MPVQITCPTCQTKLGVSPDHKPPSKVKCPKCGQVIDVSQVTIPPPVPTPGAPTQVEPSNVPRSIIPPWFNPNLLLAGFIAVALLSLALPIFLRQYVLGLILASVGLLGSIAGCMVLYLKKEKGVGTHLVGLAVCGAALLLSINALLLKSNVEKNEELQGKNEKTAAQAKADLEEAKKKLAKAEDAPRQAAELLKKAEEAPKKAEEFFKLTKDAQDKAEAAEKKTAELLGKVEELDRKIELDRKKLALDRNKIEEAQNKLREFQKILDEERKDAAEKKQELVDLQKKIDGDLKKADQKFKEAQDLFKKVENALKGAVLNLKSKKPEDRIKAARSFAKLAGLPLPEETDTGLCELVANDPVPKVREEAINALEKLRPDLYPHIVTLSLPDPGMNVHVKAIYDLGFLGKKARAAAPFVQKELSSFKKVFEKKPLGGDPGIIISLETLAKIGPNDPGMVQTIGQFSRYVLNDQDQSEFIRLASFRLMALIVEADEKMTKQVFPFFLAGLRDKSDNVRIRVINALEKFGPEAKEAVPQLRNLRFNQNAQIREAVMQALKKIEKE